MLTARAISHSMALNKQLLWRTPDTPEATHLLDSKCIYETSRGDAQEGELDSRDGVPTTDTTCNQASRASWRSARRSFRAR
jgi:hypothetical protein